MRPVHAKYFALVLTTFCFAAAQSDDIAEKNIALRVKAKIESPRHSSRQSNTIISRLGQDDLKNFKYGPYRMSLLVTDDRLAEFSMELTIFDETGTARDSSTLLASLNNEGSFQFSFDDVAISGTVKIVDIRQRQIDK